MAADIWRGPNGTSAHPNSGNFEDAANWSTGALPTTSQDVLMAPGNYTVTLSSMEVRAKSFDIGKGVTVVVTLQSGTAVGALSASTDSVNSGTIVLKGGTFNSETAGTALFNFGTIYGVSSIYVPTIYNGLDNSGLIYSNGSNFFLSGDVLNEAGGVLDTRGGGQMHLYGSLNNAGLLSARDGGTVDFRGLRAGEIGDVVNLSGGTLTGGQWSAIGASTLRLSGETPLSTIGANAIVTLNGSGSYIGVQNSSNINFSLEQTLTTIADDGVLHLLNARGFASVNSLDAFGQIDLRGGDLSAPGLVVHDDATSALVGYGTVDADMDMYGVLRADRAKGGAQPLEVTGSNDIYGQVGGQGAWLISDGEDVMHAGSQLLVKAVQITGGQLTLEQDFVYDHKLRVTGAGAIDMGNHILRLTGQVDLTNGAVGNGRLQLEGATTTVHGGTTEVTADVRNDGVLTVEAGRLSLFGNTNGAGEIDVHAGATLVIGGSITNGETIALQGDGATLAIDTFPNFRATVTGFGGGDVIDLQGLASAGASYSWKADAGGGGGTLTVAGGPSIHLEGDYRRSGFHLADDGHGGVDVTYGDGSAAIHPGWDLHGGLAV